MTIRKHRAMMQGFDKFAARMARRYDEVRDCLNASRYEEAQMLLAAIAISHAKTSLSLRNVLVKEGLVTDK